MASPMESPLGGRPAVMHEGPARPDDSEAVDRAGTQQNVQVGEPAGQHLVVPLTILSVRQKVGTHGPSGSTRTCGNMASLVNGHGCSGMAWRADWNWASRRVRCTSLGTSTNVREKSCLIRALRSGTARRRSSRFGEKMDANSPHWRVSVSKRGTTTPVPNTKPGLENPSTAPTQDGARHCTTAAPPTSSSHTAAVGPP